MRPGVEQVAAVPRTQFRRATCFFRSMQTLARARMIWNGMVPRTPALILRCADVDDVQKAVRASHPPRRPPSAAAATASPASALAMAA